MYEQESEHIRSQLKDRSKLSWQDVVELTLRFHEYRCFDFAKVKTRNKTGWTMNKTALELGIAVGKVHQDIKLAQLVRIDPKIKALPKRKFAVAFLEVLGEHKEIKTALEELNSI